jgi:hypothetical protein
VFDSRRVLFFVNGKPRILDTRTGDVREMPTADLPEGHGQFYRLAHDGRSMVMVEWAGRNDIWLLDLGS